MAIALNKWEAELIPHKCHWKWMIIPYMNRSKPFLIRHVNCLLSITFLFSFIFITHPCYHLLPSSNLELHTNNQHLVNTKFFLLLIESPAIAPPTLRTLHHHIPFVSFLDFILHSSFHLYKTFLHKTLLSTLHLPNSMPNTKNIYHNHHSMILLLIITGLDILLYGASLDSDYLPSQFFLQESLPIDSQWLLISSSNSATSALQPKVFHPFHVLYNKRFTHGPSV